jgi:hypothetical protein
MEFLHVEAQCRTNQAFGGLHTPSVSLARRTRLNMLISMGI